MLRVGLTGGFASGKSFVGRALRDLGCLLIEADQLGHRVMEKDGEAYDAIVAEFGAEILDGDGAIDRRRLAAIVFNDPPSLARLNSIVHPLVRELAHRMDREFAAREPHGISIYEAAIIIETGSFRDFDRLIVVSCTGDQQIERALAREPRLTREEALSRISRQMSLEEKVGYADYVIDTSQTKEQTLEQTRAVYASLRSIAQS